jgi:hypothetical protein
MKIGGYIKKKNAIAEISREIAQIFFGSMFIGPIVTKEVSIGIMLFGLTFSAGMWFFSVVLSKD